MRGGTLVWRWWGRGVEVVAVTVVFGVFVFRQLAFDGLLEEARVCLDFLYEWRWAWGGGLRGCFTAIWFSIFCAVCDGGRAFGVDEGYLMFIAYCVGCGDLAEGVEDGGGARHGYNYIDASA